MTGSETLVLEPDAALPQVPLEPAPWELEASAYVLAVRMPEDVSDQASFVPASLAGKRRGRTAYMLWIDYQKSKVGPYQELMVAPAIYDFGDGRYPTITRIYVSSYESVVNGRSNWGIPKDRAEFAVEREAKNVDHVRIARDGQVFADMKLRSFGLTLPVTSALLLPGLRTVTQHWQGKRYRFTLRAKGNMRFAKVVDWQFDPKYFPDLARGTVLAGAYFPKFEMTFPVPDVTPMS